MSMVDNEDGAVWSVPALSPPIAAALPADGASPRSPRVLLARLLRQREARRLIAFLMAGGISALVTITVTAMLVDVGRLAFFWSAVAGTELGILVNFSVNDALAFRDLAGHRRALPVRLARFHVTCALGQSLILLLSLLLHDIAHWPSEFAQALPIALVTGVNFLMHRFWTYRAVRGRGRA